MTDNGQHSNSHIPPAPLATDERSDIGSVKESKESFDAASALLRLLIGGLLVGADELRHRLERWEATAHAAPSATLLQTVPRSLRHTTAPASLRYAFIGMVFETEMRIRQRIPAMLARLARLSKEAEYQFVTAVEPALSQTPLEPVLMRLDELLFQAGVAIDRWKVRGWLEEQQSRGMVRQATFSTIDELLDYVAHNSELRALIEQQGASLAGEAVDEVRERTASADMWIERFARSLLHRSVSQGAALSTSVGTSPVGDTGS